MRNYVLLTVLVLGFGLGMAGCAPVSSNTPDPGSGAPGVNSSAPPTAGSANAGFPVGGGH